MFVRLKQKPYYFLTDRDTKYTYLVLNSATPQRMLFYPSQYEKMTSSQIRTHKWKLVYQLMWWSLFNSSRMTVTDAKICHSKVTDLGVTLLTGLLIGTLMRRSLFRIEVPFFDMAFQKSIFKPRWLKSMAAYSFAGFITYKSMQTVFKEEYLVDLALQYKYNFNKGLKCPEVDPILDPLCQARFKASTNSDTTL